MSESKNDARRIRYRIPPAESQVAMMLIAALVGVWALPFDAFGAGPVLFLALLFVAGMWTKRVWLIWLLLASTTYLTYFSNMPYLGYRLHSIQLSDILKALILISFAAACFRVLEADRFVSTFFPTAKFGLRPKNGAIFEFPSLLGGRWWAIPLAVILASILVTIPLGQPLRQLGIRTTTSRLIFLVLMLFFAWFVCRAIVGVFVRWRMKPEQADIQCRSLIASEFWKDTWAFEQRREKLKTGK
jgi:hypothetical protein